MTVDQLAEIIFDNAGHTHPHDGSPVNWHEAMGPWVPYRDIAIQQATAIHHALIEHGVNLGIEATRPGGAEHRAARD